VGAVHSIIYAKIIPDPTNMATTPVPEQMTMHSISELLGGIRDRQGRANPLQIDMEMLGSV
jgi:hypothetical protein